MPCDRDKELVLPEFNRCDNTERGYSEVEVEREVDTKSVREKERKIVKER